MLCYEKFKTYFKENDSEDWCGVFAVSRLIILFKGK